MKVRITSYNVCYTKLLRSGVCEQVTAKGVMCPSYRLMPGPDRSPGGRIRLLKQALNRPQQQDWLADPSYNFV